MEAANLSAHRLDPLKDVLHLRYRALMKDSLKLAMQALDARERRLLRMHFLDAMSLEAIGKIYGKNRCTVVRWLEATRKKIIAESLRVIQGQTKLSKAEAESLIGLLGSQLSVGISGLAV